MDIALTEMKIHLLDIVRNKSKRKNMLSERYSEILKTIIKENDGTCPARSSECPACPIQCRRMTSMEMTEKAKLLLNTKQNVIAEIGEY